MSRKEKKKYMSGQVREVKSITRELGRGRIFEEVERQRKSKSAKIGK